MADHTAAGIHSPPADARSVTPRPTADVPPLTRHPIMWMGLVFNLGLFGACYDLLTTATPRLIGVTGWVVPPALLALTICVALFVEGGQGSRT